ncbi:MAG: hypothetical protein WCR42_01045 [bacterium]
MRKYSFRLFAIMILSITLSLFYSCSTPNNILNKNRIIGKNLLTKSDILADELIFQDHIYDFYIDTTKRNITVQTRRIHKGQHPNKIAKLYQYDLSLQNCKWNKSLDSKYYELFQQDSLILRVHDNDVSYLNSENGTKMWSSTIDIFHVVNANLIGFKYSKWYDNKQIINGIDLNNGKSIWDREISLINGNQGALRLNDSVAMLIADGFHTYNLKNGTGWDRFVNMTYGCNEILKLNDFTKLIVADGLYSVNSNTGAGWGYKAITGVKKTIKYDIPSAVSGVGSGINSRNFLYSPYTSDLVVSKVENPSYYSIICDIVSNVIIDNHNIYWASKQNIVKLDTSGKVLWEYNLPEDEISKSKIFINDRVLCLINLGYAFSATRHHNIIYGQPFIAGFDKNTGNKLYYQSLKDNKYPVSVYKLINNTLILISNYKISKYSINNGELLNEELINTDNLGLLDSFISKNSYILKDSVLICLNDSNSNNHCILTNKQIVIQINDRLEVIHQLDNQVCYFNYLEQNNYKFVGNSTDSYILDKNDKVVAKIKASNKAILISTKLYDKQNKSMVVIDLKEILNK